VMLGVEQQLEEAPGSGEVPGIARGGAVVGGGDGHNSGRHRIQGRRR
jgi:hypothetical protein